MRGLVDQAMREGALGVGSSLIYAPGAYAQTPELIALAQVAATHGGMYISHLRSEGHRLLETIDELITISRASGARAQIYHLKAAGRDNWGKLDAAIRMIEAARAEGLEITADMYTYTAGSTGLDAAMPPWVQEGGYHAWAARLRDPATRRRVLREMAAPAGDWENLYQAGQDSRRGREVQGPVARGDGHRSGHRGREPCAGGVFPDVRGKRPSSDGVAVDGLRNSAAACIPGSSRMSPSLIRTRSRITRPTSSRTSTPPG